MSALGAASCCCPTEPPVYPGEYYVFSVCAESPCCDLECEGATDVKWCPSYASAQGLAVPIVLTPSTCIKIKVDCCTYVMTAVVPNPGGICPTGAGPWNVGTYIGTTTIGEEEGSARSGHRRCRGVRSRGHSLWFPLRRVQLQGSGDQ